MAKYQELMLFTVALTLLFAVGTSAQTPEPSLLSTEQGHNDCSDVSIKYNDDPTLTRQERLEGMDQALRKSLSTFERCQRKQLSDSTASSAASTGGGGAAGSTSGAVADQAGSSATAASVQSSASSDLAGTETQASVNKPTTASEPLASKVAGGISGNEAESTPAPALASIPADDSQGDVTNPSNQLGDGKIPEDIPNADNDSVLEAQIRRAAIAETDPEIQAKLWNEYRKYKGLPEAKK